MSVSRTLEAPSRPDLPGATTRAVRAGLESDTQFGAVVPPLHLSSTFTFADLGQPRRYDYGRSGNPTRDLLGQALAEAEGGVGAVITTSGMAAVHLALQLVEPGGRVLAPADCYGGSHRLLTALDRRGLIEADFAALDDPAELARGLERRPDLVWVETPSNPLLRLTDLAAVSRAARAIGALVVADNTFLSPALQRPLALGADVVVHSTTKYLNGHSDVVGGAVIARQAELAERLAWWGNCLGLTGSPFDSYLTLRGLRTLHVRIAQHQRNAQALAETLVGHPAVSRVHYPGLPDHPGHVLARRQQQGFGAMLSFELDPAAGEAAVRALVGGLCHFSLAESLGGVESLIAHPATMTHAAMDAEARRVAGIGDNLLRISAGIEGTSDLVADLSAGLDRALAMGDGRCATPITARAV